MIADRELAGLPVRVHYPDRGEGPFPLIVFSHGLGGSRLGYGYLGKLWADHGYVAIHPSHRESTALRLPVPVEEVEAAQGATRLEALRAMKQAIEDPRNWEARPRELSHVLDHLPSLPVAALEGRIDGSRVLVAGHSYGAYATLLSAGARPCIDGVRRDFSEPRARAFLAISPPGNGSRGLDAGSWEGVTRPVLCLTGSLDGGMQGQPPAWREESFASMPGGDKTLLVLDGVQHFTFSGGRPRSPANAEHLRQIEAAVLWFCDRHLRGVEADPPALPGARLARK